MQEKINNKLDELGSIELGVSNLKYKSISIIIKSNVTEITKMQIDCNIILSNLFPEIINNSNNLRLMPIDTKFSFFNKILLKEDILNKLNKTYGNRWKELYLKQLRKVTFR